MIRGRTRKNWSAQFFDNSPTYFLRMINQNFYVRNRLEKNAGKFDVSKNRADPSCSNISFPLVSSRMNEARSSTAFSNFIWDLDFLTAFLLVTYALWDIYDQLMKQILHFFKLLKYKIVFLELRQFLNGWVVSRYLVVLKLTRFFTRLYSEWKSAPISK